jgi:hypothetical protein
MSIKLLAYGMVHLFAFRCLRQRYEFQRKMVIVAVVDQRRLCRLLCGKASPFRGPRP